MHASSTGKAGLERRRSSLKKSSRGKAGSVGWSPMKTKAPRRPPPLVLPEISSETAEGGASFPVCSRHTMTTLCYTLT